MAKICSTCNRPLSMTCPKCGSTGISFHRDGDGGHYCHDCGRNEVGDDMTSCECARPTITRGDR